MKKALLIVDMQNDFMPGGALAVPHGDSIIKLINALQPRFDLVIASKDWHPATHGSFAINHPNAQVGDCIELGGLPQILWPSHCVQDSVGAEFVTGLDTHRLNKIIYKGTDPIIDSYSTFFDNAHRKSTGLNDYLRVSGVDELYVSGVATDYCVKCSVLDARMLGLETYVIEDACRGIERQKGDIEQALADMRCAGAKVITSNSILSKSVSGFSY